MPGPALFHYEGGDGGVEGSLRHQSVDGMGEMFPGDIIQVGADFENRVGSVFRNGGDMA